MLWVIEVFEKKSPSDAAPSKTGGYEAPDAGSSTLNWLSIVEGTRNPGSYATFSVKKDDGTVVEIAKKTW